MLQLRAGGPLGKSPTLRRDVVRRFLTNSALAVAGSLFGSPAAKKKSPSNSIERNDGHEREYHSSD
jgi:hypothetical protein